MFNVVLLSKQYLLSTLYNRFFTNFGQEDGMQICVTQFKIVMRCFAHQQHSVQNIMNKPYNFVYCCCCCLNNNIKTEFCLTAAAYCIAFFGPVHNGPGMRINFKPITMFLKNTYTTLAGISAQL